MYYGTHSKVQCHLTLVAVDRSRGTSRFDDKHAFIHLEQDTQLLITTQDVDFLDSKHSHIALDSSKEIVHTCI